MKKLLSVFLWATVLQAPAQTLIVYGDRADSIEINASRDLQADFQKACRQKTDLTRYRKGLNTAAYRQVIYVGTQTSSAFIKANAATAGQLLKNPLEPETFVLKSSNAKTHFIVGADRRGVFYGVYEFSNQVLGIDPNAYWINDRQTMKAQINIPLLAFRKPAPVYRYRGYFDNDNDLLANFKGKKQP